MNEGLHAWEILKRLTWDDMVPAIGVFILARIASGLAGWSIRHLAEKASPHLRLVILRFVPISRLLIGAAAMVFIVPILVEPKFQNVLALLAGVGIALAFAFKDYGTSLAAGLVTVLENTYQPGDWIEVDGAYGEVKSINLRAVTIVTPDDTEVIIPHSRLWSDKVFNASSGNRSLLCVADFYLHPDHDAVEVRRRLAEVAEASSFRKPETDVVVIVLEKPWGTHYRLKAYVKESRRQFHFITDMTVRGKAALLAMGAKFSQALYAEAKAR